MFDCFKNTFSKIHGIVTVSVLPRFVGACACSTWHSSTAKGTTGETHIDFDGGITAAVEDLAGLNIDDCAHEQRAPKKVSSDRQTLRCREWKNRLCVSLKTPRIVA